MSIIAPTVKAMTRRISEALGKRAGYVGFVSDFTAAFFTQGKLTYELWIELPPGHADHIHTTKVAERMCRKLNKLVPGTKGAPRGWYDHLYKELQEMGFIRSKGDPCWFLLFDEWGLVCSFPIHVDDGKGRIREDRKDEISKALNSRFKLGEFKWTQITEQSGYFEVEHTGVKYEEHADGIYWHQQHYEEASLPIIDITADRAKQLIEPATQRELRQYREAVGQLAWLCQHSRFEWLGESSFAPSMVPDCRVGDLVKVNKLIRTVKDKHNQYKNYSPKLPPGVLEILLIVDGGEGAQKSEEDKAKAQSGYAVFLGVKQDDGRYITNLIACRSHRGARVTHGSFDIECVSAISGLDMALQVQQLVQEFEHGVRPPISSLARYKTTVEDLESIKADILEHRRQILVFSDADSMVVNINTIKETATLAQRRKLDIADFRECIERKEVKGVYHINGKTNPLDCITKRYDKPGNGTKDTREKFVKILKEGWYKPDFGADNRQKKGDEQPNNKGSALTLLAARCNTNYRLQAQMRNVDVADHFKSWRQFDRINAQHLKGLNSVDEEDEGSGSDSDE